MTISSEKAWAQVPSQLCHSPATPPWPRPALRAITFTRVVIISSYYYHENQMRYYFKAPCARHRDSKLQRDVISPNSYIAKECFARLSVTSLNALPWAAPIPTDHAQPQIYQIFQAKKSKKKNSKVLMKYSKIIKIPSLGAPG